MSWVRFLVRYSIVFSVGFFCQLNCQPLSQFPFPPSCLQNSNSGGKINNSSRLSFFFSQGATGDGMNMGCGLLACQRGKKRETETKSAQEAEILNSGGKNVIPSIRDLNLSHLSKLLSNLWHLKWGSNSSWQKIQDGPINYCGLRDINLGSSTTQIPKSEGWRSERQNKSCKFGRVVEWILSIVFWIPCHPIKYQLK